MLKRITNIQWSIKERINGFIPETGIVLGSGLGSIMDDMDILYKVPYSEIEGMPVSTVEGHTGQFVFGNIYGKKVVVMQGRFHYYEGYSAEEVALPIRVMYMLGVKTLLLSNAAGGINDSFSMGDIMVITDHLNFIPNPLIGKNINELGERFPAMNDAYSAKLRTLADRCAEKSGINLKHGIYAALTGPSYETSAEIKFLRTIGADAVGMSTAPEVIAAVHCGMQVFAASVITNIHNQSSVPTHEEVVEQGKLASEKLKNLFKSIIKNI